MDLVLILTGWLTLISCASTPPTNPFAFDTPLIHYLAHTHFVDGCSKQVNKPWGLRTEAINNSWMTDMGGRGGLTDRGGEDEKENRDLCYSRPSVMTSWSTTSSFTPLPVSPLPLKLWSPITTSSSIHHIKLWLLSLPSNYRALIQYEQHSFPHMIARPLKQDV